MENTDGVGSIFLSFFTRLGGMQLMGLSYGALSRLLFLDNTTTL
jgi:hypothetical protein